MKRKENRPLLMPEEPNRGRTKVSKCFTLCHSDTHASIAIIFNLLFVFFFAFTF